MGERDHTPVNPDPTDMDAPIISAAELYSLLKNSLLKTDQVAIADCRFSLMQPELGRQQYAAEHIPGAVYLDLNQDLSSPVQPHGGRHPLPDVDTLRQKLTAMGIVSDSPEPTLVVAYDDSRLAFAARFWWLLRYLGHDRVAVLDGGWSAWKSAGYPVTAEIPVPRTGHFIPRLRPEQGVDIAQVKARKDQPGVVLMDAREAERYRGDREPIDPIAGHIPGAVNYPWQTVTDGEGTVRSPAELRQTFAPLANAQEIIVYCGSGVTACVNLLSLELAGIANSKLYVGSWSDWCSYPDAPINKVTPSGT